MIDIRAIDAHDEEAYSKFVASAPGALAYHSLPYRNLVAEHLGCEPEYLIAVDAGEIRGVLPMMWTGPPGARILNSLPYYGSHGGVVAADHAAETVLLRAYAERALDRGTAAATMVSNPFRAKGSDPAVHNLVDHRISQVTALDASGDPLELVEASARRNIRKAERLGIEIARDVRELPTLARLHRDNIESLGGRAKRPEFFEALPSHLDEGTEFDLWVARHEGRVIAALLVLYFNGTVEYFTPAIDHDHRADQPLAGLLATAMRESAAGGHRRWNWGGTWDTQDGVHRFKRKWGAQDRRYDYWVQLNDESLLDLSAGELRERYGDFYVVPFSELRVQGGEPWAARS
jgi:CelD/BcsL family acetyltransferase involved in cellulose biosynthesis